MDQRFDFDPQLPDLPLAFDLDAVARLFAERWPDPQEAALPPPRVLSCRLQDVKYRPAARCVTVYELQAERPGGAPWRTIGVLEIGPEGPAHRIYHDDPRLPWLATARDPQAMRERFAALPGLDPVEACTVTAVRYKPGSRCVFRYDLRAESGERTVFGKLLGAGVEDLLATITALHQASADDPALPGIPRPLAAWPDLRMVIQPAVAGGAELNALAFDPALDAGTRERWLRDAGARLAALHGIRGVAGPERSFAEDLDELREYQAPMAMADAPIAARYGGLLEQVAQAAEGRSAPLVASHGAFRTDQFLVEGDRLVMIDLDGFCWADPARDLGNFLAYLDWKAIRNPQQAAFIERAGQIFFEGYAAARPAPDQRWLAVYRVASLLKIAGRRYRSLTAKEWPLIPRLLDRAALS